MLALITLLYVGACKKNFTCLTCQFENILKEQDDQNFEIKQNDNYTDLQFQLDYRYLLPEHSDIIKKIVNHSTTYLSSLYQVRHQQLEDQIHHNHSCFNISLDVKRIQNSTADIYVFVTSQYSDENWVGMGGPCIINQKTHMPVVANLIINLRYINTRRMNEVNILDWVGIVTHEFTHILGFIKWMFVDKGLYQKIDNKPYFVEKKIIEYAKTYYNCDKIKGIPLENDGGLGTEGSHWEKQTFNNEIMTGSESREFSYSQFTLMAMEAIGYKVDLRKANKFTQYQFIGCEGAQGKCGSFVCKNEGYFCTSNGFSVAFCQEHSRLYQCGLEKIYHQCRWSNKRCVNGRCKSYECNDNQFSSEGVQMKQYNYLCKTECNTRGKMIDGKCFCDLGFYGTNCEKFII